MRCADVAFLVTLGLATVPSMSVAQTARAETVEIVSDGVRLAGTLYLPGIEPAAAVVLLGVAGPDDRDLRLGSLAPFRALAEHLQQAGLAVLSLDDRGVGGSGGDWWLADYATLAADALSAVEYIAWRPDVDAARIGLFGLSEGSAIAMMAAAHAPERIAFLILGSPPGLPGEATLRGQLEDALKTSPAAVADPVRAAFDRFVGLARGAATDSTVLAEFAAFLAGPGALLIPPYRFVPATPEARAALFSGPWYRSQLDYDPATFLARVTAPTLVIGGALDPVLPPAKHHPPLAAGIGSRDVRFDVVDGVNHLLLPAETGSPAEYGRIRESTDTRVLARITEWLAARGLTGGVHAIER